MTVRMRSICLVPALFACFAVACASNTSDSSDGDPKDDTFGQGEDARETSEENLTNAEKDALCNAIPTKPLTATEGQAFAREVTTRFAKLKRDNDALLAQRGVGGFAGGRSEFMKAIYANDMARAKALIAPKLKPGFRADVVAKEIQGTSCIGRVYAVFKEAYTAVGRGADWAAIEKCGRAWDSDGIRFQKALIKSGWPGPTLGLVTDTGKLPGNAADVAIHTSFLKARTAGVYYGTPVSKTMMMQNFLPSPGSRTVQDTSVFIQLGRSNFVSVGTLRGGYHVPVLVPGRTVPEDVAPQGAKRQAWLDARSRSEPFVLESHLTRAPWDATNFEIRPLTEVISETFGSTATYGTGTLLMAPGSDFVVRP
jgi:hypothetical protein